MSKRSFSSLSEDSLYSDIIPQILPLLSYKDTFALSKIVDLSHTAYQLVEPQLEILMKALAEKYDDYVKKFDNNPDEIADPVKRPVLKNWLDEENEFLLPVFRCYYLFEQNFINLLKMNPPRNREQLRMILSMVNFFILKDYYELRYNEKDNVVNRYNQQIHPDTRLCHIYTNDSHNNLIPLSSVKGLKEAVNLPRTQEEIDKLQKKLKKKYRHNERMLSLIQYYKPPIITTSKRDILQKSFHVYYDLLEFKTVSRNSIYSKLAFRNKFIKEYTSIYSDYCHYELNRCFIFTENDPVFREKSFKFHDTSSRLMSNLYYRVREFCTRSKVRNVLFG